METLPSAGARSITADRQPPASRGALTRSAPCLICALGNAGVLERKGPAEAGPKVIALCLLAGLGFGVALAHGDLLFVAVFGGAVAMTTKAIRRL
jgi:hypothetical protein